MSKDPAVYLSHILECIDLVETYISGLGLADFEERQQTQDGGAGGHQDVAPGGRRRLGQLFGALRPFGPAVRRIEDVLRFTYQLVQFGQVLGGPFAPEAEHREDCLQEKAQCKGAQDGDHPEQQLAGNDRGGEGAEVLHAGGAAGLLDLREEPGR